MGEPRGILRSCSAERCAAASTTVTDRTEKCRLNPEYLEVKLTVLDDGWNKNGDRKRKELTATAEWWWDHKLTWGTQGSIRVHCWLMMLSEMGVWGAQRHQGELLSRQSIYLPFWSLADRSQPELCILDSHQHIGRDLPEREFRLGRKYKLELSLGKLHLHNSSN